MISSPPPLVAKALAARAYTPRSIADSSGSDLSPYPYSAALVCVTCPPSGAPIPATRTGPMSQVRAIHTPVEGAMASYITDCSRFWKDVAIPESPPAARYAPASTISPVVVSVIIELMSSDAQILGALFARSNSIMLAANIPWAKISRYSIPKLFNKS